MAVSTRRPAMYAWQKAGRLRLHRHDTLDFDRDLIGQHRVTDRGAGMPSSVTEHFDKEVGAAVNDLRRLVEIRHRVDHAKQFDDELDAVERTECVAHGSKKPKSDEPSAAVAFIDADVSAELAGQRCSFLIARALAGEKQEVACESIG